jgi:hypothetical protein
LLRANALLGAAMMSAIAFGPMLAAAAIALWGPRSAFLIDGATYLVGIAVILPLRLRPITHHAEDIAEKSGSAWDELRAGLRIISERQTVRQLLLVSSSVYLVWGAYAVIEPLYVRDVLHRSASTFALFQAAFGVLLLANALIVARVGNRAASWRTVRLSALGAALCAPVYVGTNNVVVAVIGICIWGGATAWLIAPRNTLLQRATPVRAHGRVLAIDSALRSWGHVIALPVSALLLGVFGVRFAAFAFAAMPLLGLFLTRAAKEPAVVDARVEIAPAA